MAARENQRGPAATARNTRLFLITTGVVIGFAFIFTKLWLTRGQLLPGFDGAGYWIQVRAILTRGELAFPDLPLVMWTQAALASLIGDIPMAVRISDAVLPALSLIPVLILCKDARPRWVVPLVTAAVLFNSIQLFVFTGDFIKNEATVPLVFLLGLLLVRWNKDAKVRYSLGIGATITLIGLSHFGTLLLALFMMLVWGVFRIGRRSLKFWGIAVAATALAVGAVLALLARLSPARFERLVNVITHPLRLFDHPYGLSFLHESFIRPGVLFEMALGQIFSVALLVCVWFWRRGLAASTKAALFSFFLTAFIWSSPLIGAEWADRIISLSFVPLFLGAIVLWTSVKNKIATILTSLLSAISIVSSVAMSSVAVFPSVISEQQWADLQLMSRETSLESPSLVVASHGLDYLVAWQLHTDISDSTFFNLSEESGPYASVYELKRAYETRSSSVVYRNDSFTLTRLK
jgi:hypothetical protein